MIIWKSYDNFKKLRLFHCTLPGLKYFEYVTMYVSYSFVPTESQDSKFFKVFYISHDLKCPSFVILKRWILLLTGCYFKTCILLKISTLRKNTKVWNHEYFNIRIVYILTMKWHFLCKKLTTFSTICHYDNTKATIVQTR